MADNVSISQSDGTAKTVLSDEVTDATLGVGQVQYVKLMDGTVDSTTKISPATSANQATEIASLSSIDGKLTGVATAANQTSTNTKLDTLHADLTAALPAGTNLIGKVGIDQTTPGTTNGVVVNSSALPTGAATAANQTSTNTKLDQLHTDLISALPTGSNTIGAVTQASGPWSVTGSGTAGLAASGVLTVQGITSMTPVQVSQATASNLNATVTQGGTWSMTATQATASSLNATVVGSGTAGAAAGGVLTVQGVASMTPVQVSQATATNLNAAVVGTGTAGAAAGGVLTVQGVASMTPVQVSQATAANLNATVVQSTAASLNATVVGSGTVSNGTAQAGSLLAGAVFNTTPPTLTTGQQAAIQMTSRGMLLTNIASATGTSVTVNTAADALANGVGLTTSGQNFFYNGTNWDRARSATADGAATTGIGAGATMVWNGASFDRLTKAQTPFKLPSSAASNNASVVKASAGTVYGVTAFNATATTRYLKFFNVTTTPTPAATAQYDLIALPQGQTNVQFGATGQYFATGIGIAIVVNETDLDNNAIGAGDIKALVVRFS